MRWLAKLIIAVVLNGAALLLAARIIPGFELTADVRNLAIIALVLTLLNWVVKPILKMILGPIIVLTLGLGLILVNIIVIYLLDFLFITLTIQGAAAVLLAALFFGLVNFIYHIATNKSS